MNFKPVCPLLRIHVRRTDKLHGEAKRYSLKSYVEKAEEFFDDLSFSNNVSIPKKVFLASDDAGVFKQFKRK